MSDLPSEHHRDVKRYNVGVVITHPLEGGEVFETRYYQDAESEKQAVMMAHNEYENDKWEIVRLRYIKKVFTTDDK